MRLFAVLSSLLIIAVAAVVTLAAWAYYNRPLSEPRWPHTIQGFAFSPFRVDQSPIAHKFPTDAQIRSDLRLLAGKTYAVRTYQVDSTLGDIPRLARPYHINVALGAWINRDQKANEVEVKRAIAIAQANPNVVRIIVGNESILRGHVTSTELIGYLDQARAALSQPVSTAEPWYTWIQHPELVPHVDYLAVHMLPYWEGVNVHQAIPYIAARMRELEKTYPGKPIVIAEVGWPSYGLTRGSAEASPANEALFLRRFLATARLNHWVYYVMEAFDQPWKQQSEGAVGAYWGVYDVYRQPKFAFTRPIVNIQDWKYLAGTSVVVAALILTLVYWNSRTLKNRGRGFLALLVYCCTTLTVWVVHDYLRQYFTITNTVVSVLLLISMIGVVLVLLTEAHEWAEARWFTIRRRQFKLSIVADEALPFVSVHVPAYNEPPEMLVETLNALAQLDYPHYEVLVIDNNTPQQATWQPVAAHCHRLGSRFRFFHVAPLSGFKAGALNYALAHTTAEAKIVAVIDSDYVVNRRWLRDLVPMFSDYKIAVVQAPQDYRDAGQNLFKAMCYAEYRGFFYIGMITRNERNAIIQHGTMTMVRRRILERVGSWAEWCITEDAELGLKVFEYGYQAAYIPRSYGRGLMPDTFGDYKKQRFRWAYGAMQILKHHQRALFGRKSWLSAGQRYHFVAGWLPWIADGFNVVFNLGAMFWSLAIIYSPHHTSLPMLAFSALPLALFAFKLVKLVHLYRTRVGANLRQTLTAAIAGLALTHTIGLAVLSGLFTRGKTFFRTPKRASRHVLFQALRETREETLMMLALWLCAWAVYSEVGTAIRNLALWVVVLLIQSIPYCASLLVALISTLPRLPARLVGRTEGLDEVAHSVLGGQETPLRN